MKGSLMQSKRGTARVLGGLLALSLIAAGCGDDKDDEMGSSSNTTEAPSGARTGGVSAFGFGGTNFHVVVEEHIPSMTLTARN